MAEQHHAGWSHGEHEEPVGPFVQEMTPHRGVLVTDMPVGKPTLPPKPKVKGVPGASVTADDDHRPGSGAWRDA
jgi:hypothetical protein